MDDDVPDKSVNPASASEHAAGEVHALDKDHIDQLGAHAKRIFLLWR